MKALKQFILFVIAIGPASPLLSFADDLPLAKMNEADLLQVIAASQETRLSRMSNIDAEFEETISTASVPVKVFKSHYSFQRRSGNEFYEITRYRDDESVRSVSAIAWDQKRCRTAARARDGGGNERLSGQVYDSLPDYIKRIYLLHVLGMRRPDGLRLSQWIEQCESRKPWFKVAAEVTGDAAHRAVTLTVTESIGDNRCVESYTMDPAKEWAITDYEYTYTLAGGGFNKSSVQASNWSRESGEWVPMTILETSSTSALQGLSATNETRVLQFIAKLDDARTEEDILAKVVWPAGTTVIDHVEGYGYLVGEQGEHIATKIFDPSSGKIIETPTTQPTTSTAR